MTLFTSLTALCAATDPATQPLPYAQTFSALEESSSEYPSGWQGWRVGATASASFSVASPTEDQALTGSGTAASSDPTAYNYSGKLGWLGSDTADLALALALNASGASSIQVAYDIMTIRNPYDGVDNTRISEVTLQYRVGNSGEFTTLTAIEYQNNTVSQTDEVTTPQNSQTRTITLPSECENQSIVQLRWVSRDVSGAGPRPSFAVDNISVVCASPTPSAPTATPAATLCSGMSVTLTEQATGGSPPYTYQWKRNGVIITNATASSYTISAVGSEDAGEYTCDVGSFCTGAVLTSPPLNLTVNTNPVSTITAAGAVCGNSISNFASVFDAGAGATYAWIVTGGTIIGSSNLSSIVFRPTDPSNILVQCAITAPNGCSSIGATNIPVLTPPNSTISAPNVLCPESVGNVASVPDAGEGSTYSWAITGGTITAGSGTPSITFSAPPDGTISLDCTITSAAGCTSSSSTNVTVASLLVADAGTSRAICTGGSITLGGSPTASGGTPPYLYTWVPAEGLSDAASSNPVASPSENTTYTVTITDSNGCQANASILVIASLAGPLTWIGGSDNWDFNTMGQRWRDSATNLAVYCDGYDVILDDHVSVLEPTITLESGVSVAPLSLTNRSTKNYTISGGGKITGSAGVSKLGSGTLTLSTDNDFSGQIVIQEGTLAIASISALGMPAAPRTDQILLDGGTLRCLDDIAIFDANQGVTLGSAGGTFNTDAGKTLNILNPITGSGVLNKAGEGLLALANINDYSGDTVISGGTLFLAGNIDRSPNIVLGTGTTLNVSWVPSYTLASGQVLKGSGTITGTVVVASGAAIAPGNSIGTLTFQDAPVLQGDLNMEISKAGNLLTADKLSVIGHSLTNGGTLNVTLVSSSDPLTGGEIFTLFTADAYLSSFSTMNLPALGPGLNWWTNALYVNGKLAVNRSPFATSPVFTRGPGMALTIARADITSDPDGDPLDITVGSGSQGADVHVDASNIYYVPQNDHDDSLTYTINDGHDGVASGTITIHVLNSFPRSFAHLVTAHGGVMTIRFDGIPNTEYDVERSHDLRFTNPTIVLTTNAPISGAFLFSETPPGSPSFYRLRQH